MTHKIRTAVFGLAALVATPALADAQEGFALKVGAVFNSSDVEEQETNLRLSDSAGWSIGAEYLLPLGVAVGVSGYTAGSPDAFDFSEGSLVVLGDANFFFRIPMLPLSPYAGLHVGLGTYTLDEVREGVRPEVDFGDRGIQVGVRIQPTRQIGVDAQYRRVSGSLSTEQEEDFETNQFVLAVTLF